MYNTHLNITYNTLDDLSGDTVYRKELLKAFNLDVNGFHILIDNQGISLVTREREWERV